MTEVFLCAGVRTPIGRYGGALAKVRPDDMAGHVLKALLSRHPGLDPAAVDDVVFGCANQAGEDNRNVARMGLLLAGLPASVPGVTINRLCASGLEAIGTAARAIRAGEMDLVLAGGVESMTRAPFVMGKATEPFARQTDIFDTTIGWRFINPAMQVAYGTESMPETAENVAEQFQISRADQDRFALASQRKAAAAQAAGHHATEIVPIDVPAGKGKTITFTTDEHLRPDTSADSLAALKPIVRAGGTITAGNASGVNDGACAVLLANAAAIQAHCLTPLAKISAMTSAGVAPRVMGIGPVPATEKLMARLHVTMADWDVIELNEAFAAQALAVTRQLGLDDKDTRVNPNGGAIALGHPLGMSGARLALTAALELRRRGGVRALASLCVGVGQGVSLALEAA